MRTIKILFTKHPQSVGETYLEHTGAAFGFALKMFITSIACLIHAIFPFLFVNTGSKTIQNLHHGMLVSRNKSSGQLPYYNQSKTNQPDKQRS